MCTAPYYNVRVVLLCFLFSFLSSIWTARNKYTHSASTRKYGFVVVVEFFLNKKCQLCTIFIEFVQNLFLFLFESMCHNLTEVKQFLPVKCKWIAFSIEWLVFVSEISKCFCSVCLVYLFTDVDGRRNRTVKRLLALFSFYRTSYTTLHHSLRHAYIERHAQWNAEYNKQRTTIYTQLPNATAQRYVHTYKQNKTKCIHMIYTQNALRKQRRHLISTQRRSVSERRRRRRK